MRPKQLPMALVLVALLVSGCATAVVKATGGVLTRVRQGEVVAIHVPNDSSFMAEAADCIGAAVNEVSPAVRIVTPREFPSDFISDQTITEDSINEYLNSPAMESPLSDQMNSAGIRYLISLSGATEQIRKAGGVDFVGGPNGGALVGGFIWHRISSVTASVTDVKLARRIGEVNVSASGHPFFFFVFPSPIMFGLPSFTEHRACSELGAGIAKFLTGETAGNIKDQTETQDLGLPQPLTDRESGSDSREPTGFR